MLGMKLKLLYLCIVIQKALASGQVNTGASGGKRVNTLQQRGARKGITPRPWGARRERCRRRADRGCGWDRRPSHNA